MIVYINQEEYYPVYEAHRPNTWVCGFDKKAELSDQEYQDYTQACANWSNWQYRLRELYDNSDTYAKDCDLEKEIDEVISLRREKLQQRETTA